MKVRKRIILITFCLVILLIVPISIMITGFAFPSRFSESYYGELGCMYGKLKETKGKKIVIIGTSSVAFGVDSALIEENLRLAGADYTV